LQYEATVDYNNTLVFRNVNGDNDDRHLVLTLLILLLHVAVATAGQLRTSTSAAAQQLVSQPMMRRQPVY
jgi:hypothetical protein